MAAQQTPDRALAEHQRDTKEEVSRIERQDGLRYELLSEQLEVNFVDPVTGISSRARNVDDKVKLRILQSAFIYKARQLGFDPPTGVSQAFIDPVTNQALDIQTESGFQRWYECSREFVGQRSQQAADILRSRNKYVLDRNPLTNEALANDSLMLFWMRDKQLKGNDYFDEEHLREYQQEYQDMIRKYSTFLNPAHIEKQFLSSFYNSERIHRNFDAIFWSMQTQIIQGVNEVLWSIYRGNTRAVIHRGERGMADIPKTIDAVVAELQSHGVYIPESDPQTGEAYGPGSFKKLLFIRDIVEGHRQDVIEEGKRLQAEAQRKEQERKEAKRERRVAVAQNNASQTSDDQPERQKRIKTKLYFKALPSA